MMTWVSSFPGNKNATAWKEAQLNLKRINSNMDRLDLLREKIRRVAQDPDIDDKKGTQPKNIIQA